MSKQWFRMRRSIIVQPFGRNAQSGSKTIVGSTKKTDFIHTPEVLYTSIERIATNAIDQNKIVSCAARSFAIRFRFLYSSPHCVSCVRYLGSTTNRHESQQRMQQVIVAKGAMSVSGEDWARYMKMTV